MSCNGFNSDILLHCIFQILTSAKIKSATISLNVIINRLANIPVNVDTGTLVTESTPVLVRDFYFIFK